jgi:CYTH domain-containing protein
MVGGNKYAKIEWERRFLVRDFPSCSEVTAERKIVDRYIHGTTLRLRKLADKSGNPVFKLTQKLPNGRRGAQQGLITTMYLTEGEYEVFARLPAGVLTKTRHSVPPFGIDVFEGPLAGLTLAEAEFNSAAEAEALTLPGFISQEVTNDLRFTGGRLVVASRSELKAWMGEYGMRLDD